VKFEELNVKFKEVQDLIKFKDV